MGDWWNFFCVIVFKTRYNAYVNCQINVTGRRRGNRRCVFAQSLLKPLSGLKAVCGGKKKRQSLPEAGPLLPGNPSCGLVIILTELFLQLSKFFNTYVF